mgnify:CR=1 FL=1
MRAWNKTDSSILVILLLAAVALGWYYPSIPTVPSHYGLDGKVDAFSPKVFLWELYGILVSLQLILYLVGKTNPRFYNYPFEIREENRELVLRATFRLLNELRIFILLLFLLIIGFSLFSMESIPIWVLLVTVLVPILLTIKGITLIYKANKPN